MSVAANAVSRVIARAYEDRFGLTVPQWRLVAMLAERGALTPQALCGHTVMDKVTVMRAARGLLTRRLVQRLPNPQDGRSHRLHLSGTGHDLFAEIAPLALAYESDLLRGMTENEIDQLHRSLRRLEQAARQEDATKRSMACRGC